MLSYDDGLSTVVCRLLNISDGGALIRVAAPENLPDLISLFYDRLDERLPEVASAFCMVVRRDQKSAALRFLHVVA